MTSQAQIEANRRNSKRSTGPRTEEGKGRTRFNALVHGLTAQQPLLPGENPVEYGRFLNDYVFWLNPTGFVQQSIARQAASTAWRQQRIARFETIASLDDECLTCKGRSIIPPSSDENSVASGEKEPGNTGEQLGSGEGEAGNAGGPMANSGAGWQESPFSLPLEMCAFLDSPRLHTIMRYETHLNRVLNNQIKTLVMLKRERGKEDDRLFNYKARMAELARLDRDPEEEAAEIEEEFDQDMMEKLERLKAAEEAEAAAKARAYAAENQGAEERAWQEAVRAAAKKFMKEHNLENAPDKEQEAKVRAHLVEIGLFPKPPEAN
jgi:hypothetical protein